MKKALSNTSWDNIKRVCGREHWIDYITSQEAIGVKLSRRAFDNSVKIGEVDLSFLEKRISLDPFYQILQ